MPSVQLDGVQVFFAADVAMLNFLMLVTMDYDNGQWCDN